MSQWWMFDWIPNTPLLYNYFCCQKIGLKILCDLNMNLDVVQKELEDDFLTITEWLQNNYVKANHNKSDTAITPDDELFTNV